MPADNPLLQVAQRQNKPQGRWMLLLLFLFFAAPLIVVTAMYRLDWHPSGASRGNMVLPPRLVTLPDGIEDSRGQPVTADFWKEKWSMVYVAERCDDSCDAWLHDMRQIHHSLSKHIPRVQRVLLTAMTDVDALQQRYPDLCIINRPAAQYAALARQFDDDTAAPQAQRLHLVDPLGYWMMRYPKTIAARDVRKDLSRLLSYAWAG